MRGSSVESAIIEVLEKEISHLTSLQVFEAIHERLPAVNLSTVYRALERLVRQGRVSVSDMGSGSAVYELLARDHHHHLVCQQCGQVTVFGQEIMKGLFATIQSEYRFEVRTNHLILFGVCERCSGEPVDRTERHLAPQG